MLKDHLSCGLAGVFQCHRLTRSRCNAVRAGIVDTADLIDWQLAELAISFGSLQLALSTAAKLLPHCSIIRFLGSFAKLYNIAGLKQYPF